MAARSKSGAGSPVVSLAFWLDLRGYGAMLNDAGFDPTCSEAKAAIVPQLQANFAFARAYTAEQDASDGRLAGSAFYLETRLLRSGVPAWMTAGEPIQWKPKAEWLSALAATFVEVRSIKPAKDRERAIRTGREMLPSLRKT